MKLGFVSAILADESFEQVVDFAKDNSFSCVEMMCWPLGKAERRYAGVTHMDVSELNKERLLHYMDYSRKKGIEISSLGYYPNPLDPDEKKSKFYIEHIFNLISASSFLGINKITTFIGRDKNKSVEENLEVFKKVWSPIVAFAEEQNVRIAIENCPMLFTCDEWPGGFESGNNSCHLEKDV